MRTRLWVTALAAALVAAVGGRVYALGTCGSGGPVGRHVDVKFDPSEYWVWAPPTDMNKATPLVVAFHGDEGTPEQSQKFFWDPVWMADNNLVVVTPKAPYGGGSWYMAEAMHEQWVDKLMNEIFAKYNIDVDRIYATGDSGGSEFLSMYGLKRQKWFGGIQYSCGGEDYKAYQAPPRADCKMPARFVIAPSDFLYNGSKALYNVLKSKGHDALWSEQTCSGHCCGPNAEYGAGAWAWMKMHTHCLGATTPAGCGAAGALPGDQPPPDAGGGGGSGGAGAGDAGGAGGGGGGGSGGNGSGGSGNGGNGGSAGNGGGAGSGGGKGSGATPNVSGGCSYGVGVVADAAPTAALTATGLMGLALARRRVSRSRRAAAAARCPSA